MKILTINYLSHSRPEYFELTRKILKNISEPNKSKIILNVLASRDNDWINKTSDLGIETNVVIIPENSPDNYLSKISLAALSYTDYSCKLDEDCFISEHTWDYIISNLDVLNQENLILSPLTSHNIPMCDQFISDYLNNETKEQVNNLLLKQKMPNGLWGVDYSPLDQFTVNSEKWNPVEFYKGVSKMNTQTKGIHPLRINYDAQILINDFVLSNPDKLLNKQEYSLESIQRPYFTNSIFFIQTHVWADIIRNISQDAYDEIFLNIRMNAFGSKIVYIKNGFGVHIMFNTVYGNKNPWGIGGEDAETNELNFFNKLNTIYDSLHRG